jgi:DEAD/DEAH box helicase domain-containing protein
LDIEHSHTPLGSFADELERRFSGQIRAHRVMPAEDGHYSPFPQSLRPELADVLTSGGIDQLYAHQATAFDHIANGRNTVLVSRTASGKTLSFLLPILNDYLKDDGRFGVMLMYPTKALSRDQEGTLGKLLDAAGAELRLGTFDGDTPREERQRIQQQADFMITNPDMLHAGILPNHHRRWRDYLSRLRYVVIDEVHTYRGAFGSHVANVIRRLRRICNLHGADPTFVCSSATIGNPKDHVEALFGVPFEVVDQDGSPRPRRDLYMVNPPLTQSHGFMQYRKGPGSITVPLIGEAAERGIRTICFCRARQQVERLYRAVCDRHPELRHTVKPYRGAPPSSRPTLSSWESTSETWTSVCCQGILAAFPPSGNRPVASVVAETARSSCLPPVTPQSINF